jgi:hypothetical protein
MPICIERQVPASLQPAGHPQQSDSRIGIICFVCGKSSFRRQIATCGDGGNMRRFPGVSRASGRAFA